MSRENVELVRATTEAFLSGDIEAAREGLDPEIEWHGTVGGLDEGKVWRGREAVVRNFTEYFEEWERLEMHAERFIDTGGDDVVVFFHEVAKGRESGIVVETDTGTINTVRDGKMVRVRPFMDRAEALRAAGLPADMADEPSNVEIARRAFAEFGVDLTADSAWDPEVEVINAAGWVIEADYHGHEGVRRWWADLTDAFADFTLELLGVRELDVERVLTTQRSLGRFRATDIPFDAPWASILWIRDGKVVRAEGFLSERRALRAAGLLDDDSGADADPDAVPQN